MDYYDNLVISKLFIELTLVAIIKNEYKNFHVLIVHLINDSKWHFSHEWKPSRELQAYCNDFEPTICHLV